MVENGLKEQLLLSVIRFKRIDSCINISPRLQLSELAVLARAWDGCEWADKGMCVSDIHEAMHISKPAVSQILNNLEKRGLVNRAIDPADRRKITVTLTPAGERELEECKRYYSDLLDTVFNIYGVENAKTFITLMNQLMDILEQV